MIPHDLPRICTTCAVPHVENCPDCWGFGVYKQLSADGETIPVSAAEAIHGPLRREAIACPTCGGTVEGMGKKEEPTQ